MMSFNKKKKLEPPMIIELSKPIYVTRSPELDAIRTYDFEAKTLLQIVSIREPPPAQRRKHFSFVLVRDVIDRRGYCVKTRLEKCCGPLSEESCFLLYGRSFYPGRRSRSVEGSSSSSASTLSSITMPFEYATPGMLGETKNDGCQMTKDEELSSVLVTTLSKGTPFRVLRRFPCSRRAEVKLMTKEGHVGWISFLSRCQELLCDHMCRRNEKLSGVNDPYTHLRVGQILSLTMPVLLSKKEGDSDLTQATTLPAYTSCSIKQFGAKFPLRVKVAVENKTEGWISVIDSVGADVCGVEQYPSDLIEQVEKMCHVDDFGAFRRLGLVNLDAPLGLKGETSLMLACKAGAKRIVKYLLQRGADVHVESAHMTALNLVATMPKRRKIFRNSKVIAEGLLDALADINHIDGPVNEGSSLLMSIVMSGNYDWYSLIEVLLERRADTNLRNKEGQTVLDVSRLVDRTHQRPIVKMLRKVGARSGTSSSRSRQGTMATEASSTSRPSEVSSSGSEIRYIFPMRVVEGQRDPPSRR